LTDSFWDRVSPEPNSGCWLWTGVTSWSGYARLMIRGKWKYVHRLAYEYFVGPIGEGLQVDHLCRVRRCVNPKHMEIVTNRDNGLRGVGLAAVNSRKTACPRGHPYDIVRANRGTRACRTCKNIFGRASKKKMRAQRRLERQGSLA
jgi:hypothetical protein